MAATATARKLGASEERERGLLHLPDVHVPHVLVVRLPLRVPTGTAGRVLWWGGLAAVAAAGVVDWPVAALVAAGSWVAEQSAKPGQRPDRNRQADL
jgi:hypothetical protein